MNYLKVKEKLVDRLTVLWSNAGREPEKNLLIALIRLFDEDKELSDYTKFIM